MRKFVYSSLFYPLQEVHLVVTKDNFDRKFFFHPYVTSFLRSFLLSSPDSKKTIVVHCSDSSIAVSSLKLLWSFLFKKFSQFVSTDSVPFVFCLDTVVLSEDLVDFLNLHSISCSYSYRFSLKAPSILNKIKHLQIVVNSLLFHNDPVYYHRLLMVLFPQADYVIKNPTCCSYCRLAETLPFISDDSLQISARQLLISAALKDDFLFDYTKRLFSPFLVGKTKIFTVSDGLSYCKDGFVSITITPAGKILLSTKHSSVLGSLFSSSSLATIFSSLMHEWKRFFFGNDSLFQATFLPSSTCVCNERILKKNLDLLMRYHEVFYKALIEQSSLLTKPLEKSDYDWFVEQEKSIDTRIRSFLSQFSWTEV